MCKYNINKEIYIKSTYIHTREGCSTLHRVLLLERCSAEHRDKRLELTVEPSVNEAGIIHVTFLHCIYSIGTKTPGVFSSHLEIQMKSSHI